MKKDPKVFLSHIMESISLQQELWSPDPGPPVRARAGPGGRLLTGGPASGGSEREHAITFAPATAKGLIFKGLIVSLRGDLLC